MIKVDGLLKKYGRKTVIDHIDLHLENKTYA
ncbi:MAG TPA: peptide ABC transporter ATP-binding protein, partial [Kandleria vitulina]|nr:peptide ABC transporter ATP-binding protein [Kandleria vitulina]